jgi:LacI family transcriptional regulator
MVVVLGTTGRTTDRELELLNTLRAHRARAVVLAGSRTTDRAATTRLAREIQAFVAQGGRVACVSQARLPADTVVPGNRAGARALAHELVSLGHRRFAVLPGPPDLITARDRLTGFRTGLAEAGVELPDASVFPGAFTRDGGYQATLEVLAARTGATCVFAVNDVMALGAMAALRSRKVRIPDDVSVAGFDDIPTLRDLAPGLSTVRLPLEEIGARAAQLALDGDEPPEPRTVRIGGEVVLRESTCPPSGPGLR